MGLFDGMRAKAQGRAAYAAHVRGNRAAEAGKWQEAQSLHEQALKSYETAVQHGCGNVQYLMAYGVLLLRMRQFEKARDMLRLAEKQPGISRDDRKKLRINYAICQWKLGELDRAIEQLTIAGEDGKNSLIYGSLGYMLIEQGERDGDFSKALAFNTEAMDYDGEDAVVLDNMGQLYLRMGECDKARGYFIRAHEARPSQVDTLYYLAKLAHGDGDDDAAREYLSDALKGNYSALCTTTREQAQALMDALG